MSRRRILSSLLLLILAACQAAPADLTGTPSKAATRTPRATSTPKSGTRLGVQPQALKGVTVQVWTPWFGIESTLFDSFVKEFNQSNDWGITVQSTSQVNYAQLYDNATAAMPTADRPQLVIALPENALVWNADGFVTDLTAYVNDPQYGFTTQDVQDFPTVFWSQDAIGGKRLGIPAERSTRLLLYNSSWARELGFDAPPRTADDFQQQSCRAHQAMQTDQDRTNDGQGGWLVDTDSMTALSWLTAFGGGVLEGNDYRFLTPKNIAALTFVKQLYDDGCAWTAQQNVDPLTDPGHSPPEIFASRKALFATASLGELPDFARAMGAASNPDKWTVLSFPGDIQTGLIIDGSSYVVLDSTPEQQLASWLFVRWMLSPENQKKWVEVTGLFPLRRAALDLLGDYSNSHPQWAAAVDLLPEAQIQPQLASWRKVRVMIGDGFDAMFRTNTQAGRVAEILAIMESTSRDLSK